MARSSGTSPGVNPSMVGAPSWWGNLILNDRGNPRSVTINGDIAMSQDPAFQNAFAYNEFRNEAMAMRPLPWDPALANPRPIIDADDYEASIWLQENQIFLKKNDAKDVINGIAYRNKYHPVKEYFDTLGGLNAAQSAWDGISRIGDDKTPSWLTYYCGVRDSPYVRAIGARWLIQAVARIYQPGCKADCVLILEGPTGIGKSTVFKILGGLWYSNDIKSLSSSDAQEQIIGIWIMELDEMHAVSRAESTAVISFVSRSTDHFRLKYGRRSGDFPRQCVFGGTTERDAWVNEFIGYRRWWPVRCGPRIDRDALEKDRDQLWAEALLRYAAGERWWLHEDELVDEAARHQEARVERDPWEDRIGEYCRGKPWVIPNEIFDDLGVPLERRGKSEQMRVTGILRRHGWVRKQKMIFNKHIAKNEPKWVFLSPEQARKEEQEENGSSNNVGFV